MKRYPAVSLLFAGLLALAATLGARAATTAPGRTTGHRHDCRPGQQRRHDNVFSESLDLIYAAYPDRVTSNRLFPVKIVAGISGRF